MSIGSQVCVYGVSLALQTGIAALYAGLATPLGAAAGAVYGIGSAVAGAASLKGLSAGVICATEGANISEGAGCSLNISIIAASIFATISGGAGAMLAAGYVTTFGAGVSFAAGYILTAICIVVPLAIAIFCCCCYCCEGALGALLGGGGSDDNGDAAIANAFRNAGGNNHSTGLTNFSSRGFAAGLAAQLRDPVDIDDAGGRSNFGSSASAHPVDDDADDGIPLLDQAAAGNRLVGVGGAGAYPVDDTDDAEDDGIPLLDQAAVDEPFVEEA